MPFYKIGIQWKKVFRDVAIWTNLVKKNNSMGETKSNYSGKLSQTLESLKGYRRVS
jgi:hypothetical protein